MRSIAFLNQPESFSSSSPVSSISGRRPRRMIIGLMLVLALFAFEMFNFDTTRFALESFLGEVHFAGLGWAAILAIAFCAIDFAGLARLFTPGQGSETSKEIWYLTGAWLLGATMNAVMTWWAVSLTLLNHDLGNEILSREQLLSIVPMFVAALVWLTRILFIGALAVAGESLLHPETKLHPAKSIHQKTLQPLRLRLNGSDHRSRRQSEESLEVIDLSQPVAAADQPDGRVSQPVESSL